jgi:hypothetical protein
VSTNLFQAITNAIPEAAIAAAFRAQPDEAIVAVFRSLAPAAQSAILTGVITTAAAGVASAGPKPRAARKPAAEKPAKQERKAASSTRGTNADNDAADAAVLHALASGQAGRAVLVEATGLPEEDVRKAILRLSRNEKIVSNGLRGLGAAYTVAHVRDAAA